MSTTPAAAPKLQHDPSQINVPTHLPELKMPENASFQLDCMDAHGHDDQVSLPTLFHVVDIMRMLACVHLHRIAFPDVYKTRWQKKKTSDEALATSATGAIAADSVKVPMPTAQAQVEGGASSYWPDVNTDISYALILRCLFTNEKANAIAKNFIDTLQKCGCPSASGSLPEELSYFACAYNDTFTSKLAKRRIISLAKRAMQRLVFYSASRRNEW